MDRNNYQNSNSGRFKDQSYSNWNLERNRRHGHGGTTYRVPPTESYLSNYVHSQPHQQDTIKIKNTAKNPSRSILDDDTEVCRIFQQMLSKSPTEEEDLKQDCHLQTPRLSGSRKVHEIRDDLQRDRRIREEKSRLREQQERYLQDQQYHFTTQEYHNHVDDDTFLHAQTFFDKGDGSSRRIFEECHRLTKEAHSLTAIPDKEEPTKTRGLPNKVLEMSTLEPPKYSAYRPPPQDLSHSQYQEYQPSPQQTENNNIAMSPSQYIFTPRFCERCSSNTNSPLNSPHSYGYMDSSSPTPCILRQTPREFGVTPSQSGRFYPDPVVILQPPQLQQPQPVYILQNQNGGSESIFLQPVAAMSQTAFSAMQSPIFLQQGLGNVSGNISATGTSSSLEIKQSQVTLETKTTHLDLTSYHQFKQQEEQRVSEEIKKRTLRRMAKGGPEVIVETPRSQNDDPISSRSRKSERKEWKIDVKKEKKIRSIPFEVDVKTVEEYEEYISSARDNEEMKKKVKPKEVKNDRTKLVEIDMKNLKQNIKLKPFTKSESKISKIPLPQELKELAIPKTFTRSDSRLEKIQQDYKKRNQRKKWQLKKSSRNEEDFDEPAPPAEQPEAEDLHYEGQVASKCSSNQTVVLSSSRLEMQLPVINTPEEVNPSESWEDIATTADLHEEYEDDFVNVKDPDEELEDFYYPGDSKPSCKRLDVAGPSVSDSKLVLPEKSSNKRLIRILVKSSIPEVTPKTPKEKNKPRAKWKTERPGTKGVPALIGTSESTDEAETRSLEDGILDLQAPEWYSNVLGLKVIMQRCEEDHHCLISKLNVILPLIQKHLRSPSSKLSRQSIRCLSYLFPRIGTHLDSHLNTISERLFARMANTNKFMRDECENCLLSMISSCSHGKVVRILENVAKKHRQMVVRVIAMKLVRAFLDVMEPEIALLQYPELILPLLYSTLGEKSAELREEAKRCLKVLLPVPRFDAYVSQYVSRELFFSICPKVEKIKDEVFERAPIAKKDVLKIKLL